MTFADRGRRVEEQIDVLRRLWQNPVVSFEGRYHTITAAGINPLPVQRPIPIWMGGFSEPALKRIARLADGYFPGSMPLEGGWRETLERMRAWRQAAGRDPTDLGIEARIQTGTGSPGRLAPTDRGMAIARGHAPLHQHHGRRTHRSRGSHRADHRGKGSAHGPLEGERLLPTATAPIPRNPLARRTDPRAYHRRDVAIRP